MGIGKQKSRDNDSLCDSERPLDVKLISSA